MPLYIPSCIQLLSRFQLSLVTNLKQSRNVKSSVSLVRSVSFRSLLDRTVPSSKCFLFSTISLVSENVLLTSVPCRQAFSTRNSVNLYNDECSSHVRNPSIVRYVSSIPARNWSCYNINNNNINNNKKRLDRTDQQRNILYFTSSNHAMSSNRELKIEVRTTAESDEFEKVDRNSLPILMDTTDQKSSNEISILHVPTVADTTTENENRNVYRSKDNIFKQDNSNRNDCSVPEHFNTTTTRNDEDEEQIIIPISQLGTSLNLFTKKSTSMNRLVSGSPSWKIRARVVRKSTIRMWSKNGPGISLNRNGSLFTVELLDESGVDIRATFFTDAVDAFYNFLQPSHIYDFSGGRLTYCDPTYYNPCRSRLQLTFSNLSKVRIVEYHPPFSASKGVSTNTSETSSIIPEHCISITDIRVDTVTTIRDIRNIPRDEIRPRMNKDVIAVVESVGSVSRFISRKNGKQYVKCEVTLVDDSNSEINLVLWYDQAETAANDYKDNPILYIRGANFSDFNAGDYQWKRSISSVYSVEKVHYDENFKTSSAAVSSDSDLLEDTSPMHDKIQIVSYWRQQQQNKQGITQTSVTKELNHPMIRDLQQ